MPTNSRSEEVAAVVEEVVEAAGQAVVVAAADQFRPTRSHRRQIWVVERGMGQVRHDHTATAIVEVLQFLIQLGVGPPQEALRHSCCLLQHWRSSLRYGCSRSTHTLAMVATVGLMKMGETGRQT